MKNYYKIIVFLIFLTAGTQFCTAQINRQLNTRKISNANLSNLSVAIPIKKTDEKKLMSILDKDIPESALIEIKIPSSYMNKRPQKSWRITPGRAFGPGNLGFGFLSGWLTRDAFALERDFWDSRDDQGRREAMAFVGSITFDARYNKEYLIRVISYAPVHSTSYIKTKIGDVEARANSYNNDSFLILVRAQEAGKLSIPISALNYHGESERYPALLLIKEIIIDEL